MATAPPPPGNKGSSPDPNAIYDPSGNQVTPIATQVAQAEEIAIIQAEDPTLPPVNGVLGDYL